MDWRFFGAKPLTEPNADHLSTETLLIDPNFNQTQNKDIFYNTTKYRLQSINYFVPVSIC